MRRVLGSCRVRNDEWHTGSATDGPADGSIDGYTIAESAVALALLLTVLVPAVGTLSYLVTQQRTQHRIEALALARHEMERTLATEGFGTREGEVERQNAPWRTVREIEQQGGLVLVTVSVYRSAREEPLLQLQTARLDDQLVDRSANERVGP